jgi:hypothetical protein
MSANQNENRANSYQRNQNININQNGNEVNMPTSQKLTSQYAKSQPAN